MEAILGSGERSQAVRLPQEFRFEGDEVEIRREGELVVLAPVVRQRFEPAYWAAVDALSADVDLDTAEVEPLGGRLLDIDVDEPDE